MSKHERTGNSPDPEPPTPRSRWGRQLRNDAGLHLLRSAATAIGSAVITYGLVWVQTR
ncbi:hypothetical protein ACFUJR_37515 [Streptomyces sp. NPDC057271]|uniref:hypothetical protein n=1 Tax=unclassified Streptomyces TaxID=2593676 RepID=UPI00362B0813